jgi:hypothetical protein
MKNFQNITLIKFGLLIVLLVTIHGLKAQSDTSYRYSINLDPLAFFYNKQSLHIGMEAYVNKFLLGTSADYYLDILSKANSLSNEGLSYGISGKAGLDLLPGKKKMIHFGLAFRYDRFHVEAIDYDPFKPGRETSLFYKSWNQFTPMMFIQVNTFNTGRIFLGVQASIGKTFMTDITSIRLNRMATPKNSGDLNIEFPGIFPDALIPSNRNGAEYTPMPDIRLSVWFGYRFGMIKK